MRSRAWWLLSAVAVLAAGCGSDNASSTTAVAPTRDSVVASTSSSTSAPIPSSTTDTAAPDTTVPTSEAQVLYIDVDGMWLWAESGKRVQVREGAFGAAIPDGLGGIVYQELETGAWRGESADMSVARWTWKGEGSAQPIIWLPELGGSGEIAVEPPIDGKVELVDVALADGHPLLAYVRTRYYEVTPTLDGDNPWWDAAIAELVVKDLVTGDEQAVYEQSVGWEYSTLDPSLGNDTVGVVVREYGGDVESLMLYDFDGNVLSPGFGLPECAPPCGMEADLPPSGATLAVAVREGGDSEVVVEVIDRGTGAVSASAVVATGSEPQAVDLVDGRVLVVTTTREAVPPSDWPSLRRGDIGEWVRVLQQSLPHDGYLVADGRFGADTEAAVIAFQTLNGLEPTGVVGEAEWRAMMTSVDRLDQPVLVEADGSARVLEVLPTDAPTPWLRWGADPSIRLWSD